MKHGFWLVCGALMLQTAASAQVQSYEEVGYFCPTCTTDGKARQVALGSVPRPACDWDPHRAGDPAANARADDETAIDETLPNREELSGDPPQCGAPLRRVVIVNHNTGQLFPYLVGWNQSQWQYVILQDAPLNADEEYAHERLIAFRLQWEQVLTNPAPFGGQTQAILDERVALRSDDCGVMGITVLDVALFSEDRRIAMDAIRNVVRRGVENFEADKPWIRGGTIGINARFVHAEADIERPLRERLTRVILEMDSEMGGRNDIATFGVELLGVTDNGNTPAATITFQPEHSVALGHPLEDVLSGDVNVEDNPCVRDKLATRATNDGEMEVRTSGGQRIDPSILRGPSFPPGPSCYIYFYQDGRLLYIFRVDCSRLH